MFSGKIMRTILQSEKSFTKVSRGDRIRTYDLLVPNQALYQAKLHPEAADKGLLKAELST